MKTKYILSCAMLATVLAGCTDLDVDIKSAYTEFPSSEIAAEAKTNEAYYAFRGALGRRFDEGNSMNSDEYVGISFGGDYLNNRDCANFTLHSINPTNCDAQLNVYSDIQSGITKCNQVIMDLGGEEKDVTAPVRAVRAFYTFLLMDQWGNTPIIDHLLEEDEVIERSDRATVAQWIESELLAVRSKCSSAVDASTYGKPTKWMVEALLAKLYLNWNVYTQDVTSASWSATATNSKLNDCIANCDSIIASGKFDLSDDFKSKFLYNNGYKVKDFIYAMPFDATTATGMTYARFRTWRQGQKSNGMYSVEMTNSVGGNFALNPSYASLFCLSGDRRNDVIAGDGTADTFDVYQYDAVSGEKTSVRNYYKSESDPVTFTKYITLAEVSADLNTGKNLQGWTQGYKSIKFFPYVSEYNTKSRNQSNDVPIFRYADILLMKAEALLRAEAASQGSNAVALNLINQVRSAAKAPTLATGTVVTLQDILDERGREFLDEHWRRNDLIRFGKFESYLSDKIFIGPDGKKLSILDINPDAAKLTNRLWPLGITVLNNNTNWSQNAGY